MTFVEELFANMAIKSSIATPTVISKAIKLLTVLKSLSGIAFVVKHDPLKVECAS